jgi:pimeloyl-ACP methyl ester carboxylesterase
MMESRVIDVQGVATYLLEVGAGDPVLLVHGSGPGITASMSWLPVMESLAAAGRRVIAVDMPGYGKSAPLPDADTPVNVAAHLEALLDALGIGEAAVIGHSRGGRIATELAIRVPHRLTSLSVIGSGSVAPGGHVNDDGTWTAAAVALVNFGRDGDTSFETFRDAYATQLYAKTILDDVLAAAYEDTVSSGVLAHFIEQMQVNDPLNHYHKQDTDGFLAKLRSIELPTLVVWGREDECSSYRKGLRLVDVIPDIEFSLLPRCGHFVMVDQPERYSSIQSGFLDGVTVKAHEAKAGAR